MSVDRDASSVYFRPPAGKGHRRGRGNKSIASIMSSAGGPPVSMGSRSDVSFSFKHGHSRNDTLTSGSSFADAYAAGGANGDRAALRDVNMICLWIRQMTSR
jgi:hypothetical protein